MATDLGLRQGDQTSTAAAPPHGTPPVVGLSPRQLALRALVRHRGAWLGSGILLAFVLIATFAPLLAPRDPLAIDPIGLTPPSWEHPMGTDGFGRDILSRVIHGSRLSLLVAFSSVAISGVVGVVIGLVSGYFGRRLDGLLMRSMDVLLAFPGLILALALSAVMGGGMLAVIVAVGVAGIPNFARVTRGAVLAVKNEDYVLAARAAGCRSTVILRRHVLPNVTSPIIVMVTLYLAYAVLSAASISFLGVGVQPPSPEWGAMANAGRAVLTQGWWVSTFPSVMVMLFVVGANVLGDALRDSLDARLRGTT